MRNEALELPKDTGHYLVSLRRNVASSNKLNGFPERKPVSDRTN